MRRWAALLDFRRLSAELAKLLADRRPDFVLPMEMFERDVREW
jgi:hypothetical protein